MTVLEGLIRIKNELDGRLALRYSCRSAICGSCAMQINGTQKLACRTSVRKELERHGKITIQPLPNLPLIKDLVVDMAPFWEKIRAVTPWLTPVTHPTKRYGGRYSCLDWFTRRTTATSCRSSKKCSPIFGIRGR